MKHSEHTIRSIKYLEEDFGFADLVVSPTEDHRADFVGGGPAVLFVGRSNARGQDSVAIYKVLEYVPDRISSFTDSNGFHHT